MMHWGRYGWAMGFGWIYMIIFWAVIILIVVYLVKTFGNRWGSEVRRETPLEILKRRYARGEITREEFERMKGELRKS